MSELAREMPLVTVGVPVRNGAATLGKALESIARQTYPNLEIVVSDNASDDGTAELVDAFARTDDRVRVLHQQQSLTMFGNHAATYREARGTYLIWLAHDDLLSDDLIARLVPVMEADDDVVLAFGEVHLFTDYEHLSDRRPLEHHFDTAGLPTWRRLWRDRNSGWEAKGLIRRSALASYRWWEHTVSPDWPLLTHLLVAGEVREVPGAVLLVGYRPDLKTTEERAALQSYSSVERFSVVKLSWRSALAARDAGRQVGRRRFPPLDLVVILGGLVWANRRSFSPFALDAWRRRFSRLRRAAG